MSEILMIALSSFFLTLFGLTLGFLFLQIQSKN